MRSRLARVWHTVKVYFGFAAPEDPGFIGGPFWDWRV